MLIDALHDCDIGTAITYQFEGKLFNMQRLQAISKVKNYINHDLLFVDDCALHASTQSKMQESLNLFSAACEDFGLKISIKVLRSCTNPLLLYCTQGPQSEWLVKSLLWAISSSILAAALSRTVMINEEVNYRTACVTVPYGRLHVSVRERRGIRL